MANVLNTDKQIAVISALAEGSSIRSIERMTPSAKTVYAWAHQTGNPDKPLRHVTVLRSAFVESPLDAVKAAIVMEVKGLDAAEEN